MHLLLCFSFYFAYFRFHYLAKHIPGPMNIAADALSRNKLFLLSSVIPQTLQCSLPLALSQLLITTRPDWESPTWTQLFTRSLTQVLQGQRLAPMNQASIGGRA